MTRHPLVGPGNVDLTAMLPIDCRWVVGSPAAGREAYLSGHLPGALYMSLDDDLSDMRVPDAGRHPLPSKDDFTATLGRLGVGNADTVLAYDDAGGAIAARLWWMLRWVGHTNVVVLDGGIQAWTGAGRPVDSGIVHRPTTLFQPGESSMPVAHRQDVATRPEHVVLLDARAGERFRGEVEPLDPVAGHIPGAVSAPYADNLDAGRFLPPARLATRFADLGVAEGNRAIVYCGSGVTACHDVLAMEIAGRGTAALYPGSWSEWSQAGGEVATGL